ncbi:MAG: hypothetical protein R6V21_04355, partial [Pelovirga sp.]
SSVAGNSSQADHRVVKRKKPLNALMRLRLRCHSDGISYTPLRDLVGKVVTRIIVEIEFKCPTKRHFIEFLAASLIKK